MNKVYEIGGSLTSNEGGKWGKYEIMSAGVAAMRSI